jgi:hypothetical protein
MKGFTQAYWGLRGTIASLIKSVNTSRVTNLETYLLPKSELLKVVKTKFAYQNGGVFRPEEIAYLDVRYASHKTALDEFLNRLDHPDAALARDFQTLYSQIRARIKKCDDEIRNTETQRARQLFPSGEKKSQKRFKQMSLTEKIATFTPERKIHFKPESLPGIIFINSDTNADVGTETWLIAHYGLEADDNTRATCLSWYSNFWESSEEDD